MNDQDLLACVRALVGGARPAKEIKMFGGSGFMLNGNLLASVSRRGLLARVGKDAERAALMRPGATPVVMRGRTMNGYVRVGASALDERAVASWIQVARQFVQTLPKKKAAPKANPGRTQPSKPKGSQKKARKTKPSKTKPSKEKRSR